MGKFQVTGPNGQVYEITAPDGASEQDVLSFVQQQVSGGSHASAPARTPGGNFTPNAGATWGAGDNFSSGVWQGLGDEIKAGAAAAKESLSGGLPFGKAYDQAKTAYQGARSDYTEENPKMGTATDIAGQVAPWMLGGGVVAASRAAPGAVGAASRALAPAATIPGRMAKGAAAGTGIGAASGFTNAEGDLTDRAKGAGVGASIGAFTGALAPPVIEGIAAVGKAGVQKILNGVAGGFTQAEQKLANAIAEMGGGDLKAGIAMVKSALSAGDDLALVDTIGIRGQKLGRAAANVPGESAQMADDFVSQRVAGRGERLQKSADNLAPNKFYQSIDDLTAAQKASARPLYEEAFAPVSDKTGKVFAQWDDRLQQFLDDPIVRKGLNKGIRVQQLEALAEGRPFNFQEFAVKGFDDAGELIIDGTPNLRAMDAAKRGLDDILEGYRDKTTGKLVLDDMGRAINSVRKALVSKLDEITTDQSTGRSAYREARAAYAGPATLKDAHWSGRRFMRGDEEMTKKIFIGMTDAEKEAFQLGVRRELSSLITKDTQTAVNKFADKKADFWGRLENIFPPERMAAFRKSIESERSKFESEQFVSPRAGSHTAGLKEDIAELGRTPGVAMDVVGSLSTGDKIGALGALLKGPIQKFTAPNQKTANALANALFDLDPARQQQMLNSLSSKRVAEDVMPYLSVDKRKIMAQLLARGGTSAGASQAGQMP